MVVAAPPPPPPSEAPVEAQVLRAESRFVAAVVRDVPVVMTNKAGRVENGLVRYQLYVKTEVRALGREALAPDCVWTMTTHLQRQLCFTSMTGQFACTETALSDLPDKQSGAAQLSSAASVADCGIANPAVVGAERQLSQALAATVSARVDADLKQAVTPMLVKSGAAVKRVN